MSKPCSQLNSKAIRDKAECEIVARVEKLCSIVAFKCVWRVDHQEIENAWNWICEKRDECDLILSKLSEVCFLFSAISTSQWDSKKRKKTERSQETRESGDSNDESPNTASQLSSPGKQTFPAISYWVACQTRNGSPINALKIQRAVGSCGLEFYISRASRKTNSVHLLNQLCQVLKDHKNPCLMRLVESSYQHCLRALQEELVVDDYEESQELSPTENVVRLRVVLDNFKQMLVASVLELRRAGLVLDTFGFDKNLPTTSQTTSDPPHKPLSCPITVLCNDVQLVMRKLNYAIYRGEVYKMTAKSKFTYQYLCSMKTFLHNLMGNEAFKDRLVQHIQRVLPILSEPESSVVPQIKIDRDLIEVQGGWFWSFSCGSFVQGIITESQKGVKTPRAFVDYDRLKDPNPRYFEDILRNSLSEDKIQQFCADFLALFRPKEHKQPVPCAIGSSDSGKTSLFAPVFQIVNLNRIARVTKQKNFNKAMIDSLTEVIFLDEAYPGLLDIDDWKIMCQGGFTSHDAKWKKAQGFHCSATMYITCQTEMDFGMDHNEAMDRRLHKYHFKSLAHVVPEANKWMKEHAMDIIVWAQYIAGGSPCSVAPVPVVHDNGLPEDELRNILNVSLIDEEVSESSQTGCAQESVAQLTHSSSGSDADITDDGSDAVEIETLRREYAKAKEESVRQRQLKMLLNNSERTRQSNRRLSKTMRDHRLAHRRRTLVELGVVEQSEVSQLVTDADNPLPEDLERKQEKALEERHQLRVAQQQRENELKAKRAYSNPWLLNMEKDMAEHSKRVEQTRDSEERAIMDSLLEVNSNKLRLFHEGQGTLGLQVAVEERKKMCLERGLVERGLVDCIRNVFAPLPVIVDAASSSSHQQLSASRMFTPPRSEDGIDEEEEMFITPKTPSYAPSFDALCPPSPCSFSNTRRKRPRLAQSQLSKGQKKIDNFFVSQK